MPIDAVSLQGMMPIKTGAPTAGANTGQKAASKENPSTPAAGSQKAAGEKLTAEEKKEVAELQKRDREVRAHEMAHKAAGAGVTGAVSYSYQVGPDGKRYAVGGEVAISVNPENDPDKTIAKMQRVRAAALAPAEPSPQDRAVARQAQSEIQRANRQKAEEQAQETAAQTETGRGVNVYA